MAKLPIAAALAAPLTAQVLPLPKTFQSPAAPASYASVQVAAESDRFTPQVTAFVGALQTLGIRSTTPGVAKIAFTEAKLEAGITYRIRRKDARITVIANSTAGAAQAAATLLQCIRLRDGKILVGLDEVSDGPDFGYRSFMIDMGRNPHSPATLRNVVDMMWLCKGNYLQLHLTDDQLFSWPSRAYPKLLSKRAGWTWQDFVDLENYSQARGVTIIPELDVPGHSSILRRRYPEIFGKTPTDLASSAKAQKGVETLLGEMLEVFAAAPYVHVGGDEAYGVPQDTQRDFINRLNRFVRSTGRRTLVWEGPGLGPEGKRVDRNVIHVNWQTTSFPAQQMLDAGYEVINAAWDPFYIVDHYPRTMFTAVDLERCYGMEITRFGHIDHAFRTFAQPHRTKTASGLLGICMPWWEGREENLLKLCLPRFAAVASAAWNRSGENDFAGFLTRLEHTATLHAQITGTPRPRIPEASAASQSDNLAFRGKVTTSAGSTQPWFGPQRLTNGIATRFDHFLGFPTKPKPLEIVIQLQKAAKVGRIVVHETAVGKSHEIYELFVSADGQEFESVGAAKSGTRGKKDHVTHVFEPRTVQTIKIVTRGCHGLTFPSFSRLTEVRAFQR